MSGRRSVDDGAFDYHRRKDGTVVISYYNRSVTTLSGKDAMKSTGRIERLKAQLLMARVTGNFKRGNERRA